MSISAESKEVSLGNSVTNIDDEKNEQDDEQTIISKSITDLYSSARYIIKEFVEDGLISGFKDIPQLVWYNLLSSLCSMVKRFDSIKNNEKLKELVVFKTVRMIIEKDIPINQKDKKKVLDIFDKIAPSIIDVLIPGQRKPGQPLSLSEKIMNKICKFCGCGTL